MSLLQMLLKCAKCDVDSPVANAIPSITAETFTATQVEAYAYGPELSPIPTTWQAPDLPVWPSVVRPNPTGLRTGLKGRATWVPFCPGPISRLDLTLTRRGESDLNGLAGRRGPEAKTTQDKIVKDF